MPEYFKIPCPSCTKSLKVSDALCGKSRACPYCRATVRIPETPPESPEAETFFPGIDTGAPVAGTKGVAGQATGAAKPAPVHHHRAKKHWFQSSSDSASSDVSLLLSGLLAAGATLVWFALLFPLRQTYFGALFWMRGPVPFPTTFLMFWAIAILALKWVRLRQQRDAMLLDVLPTEVSKDITVDSVDSFIAHINDLPGAGSDSFLVNRVVRGLEHFRVRRNAAETVTMMESQSEIDANNVAGSYSILKVFIWSLPILGFIGTVMGVSGAVASLAGSLGSGGLDAMKGALQDVFGGLGTAFDTTLLALIMSMLVKIPASALQKGEEDLITRVDEYCNENLLRRLNDGRAEAPTRDPAEAISTDAFREAVEQALGTQHAEMERWLKKLDAIGGRLTEQVASGWDQVNRRIEKQQQKHVAVLHQQQLDQQARLQAQLDQMANAAGKIQASLTQLAEQTEALQARVSASFDQTDDALKQHLIGVEKGLQDLGSVLQKLDGQVVVQQVAATSPARRGWFGRRASAGKRNGSR